MSVRPGSERGHGLLGVGLCPACLSVGAITDGHRICRRCEGYPTPVTLRLSRDLYDQVERAATLESMSIEAFVLSAATDAAERIIARSRGDA